VRLIAATAAPDVPKDDATWYMITDLPLSAVSAVEVYELYGQRDWIENRPATLPRYEAAVGCGIDCLLSCVHCSAPQEGDGPSSGDGCAARMRSSRVAAMALAVPG